MRNINKNMVITILVSLAAWFYVVAPQIEKLKNKQ